MTRKTTTSVYIAIATALVLLASGAHSQDPDNDGYDTPNEIDCGTDPNDRLSYPFDWDGDDFCEQNQSSAPAFDETLFDGIGWTLFASRNDLSDIGGTPIAMALQPDGKFVMLYIDFLQRTGLTRIDATGDLDLDFAAGGHRALPTRWDPESLEMLLQPDGKIVIAATFRDKGRTPNQDLRANEKVTVFRLLPDGSFDPDFGTDGRITHTVFSPDLREREQIEQLALQTGNRLLLRTDQGVMRLAEDASIDESFGAAGYRPCQDCRLLTQPDDRILVIRAGTDPTLERWLPDGADDIPFDIQAVPVPVGLNLADEVVVRDGAGGFYLVGSSFVTSTPLTFQMFVAKYDNNVMLDTAFGTGGTRTLPLPPGILTPFPFGAATTPDNGLLVGSAVFGSTSPYALQKLDSQGMLDTSFGTNGTFQDNGLERIADVTAQPDGKVALLVLVDVFPELAQEVLGSGIARYSSDMQQLDASFSSDGVTNEKNKGVATAPFAIKPAADGGFLIAGSSGRRIFGGNVHYLPLLRNAAASSFGSNCFLGRRDDTFLPLDSFGTGGEVSFTTASACSLHDVAEQNDGSLIGVGAILDFTMGPANQGIRLYTDAAGSASGIGGGTGIIHDEFVENWNQVIALPDGKALVAGSGDGFGMIARFLDNGQFDPTFGTGGRVEFPAQGVLQIALQSTGRILVYGFEDTGNPVGWIRRLLPDGALDASFVGEEGRTLPNLAANFNDGLMAVYPDDRFVTLDGGRLINGSSSDLDTGLSQFTPDGLPDPGFNGIGAVNLFETPALGPFLYLLFPFLGNSAETIFQRPPPRGFAAGRLALDSEENILVVLQVTTTPNNSGDVENIASDTTITRRTSAGEVDDSFDIFGFNPEFTQVVVPTNEYITGLIPAENQSFWIAGYALQTFPTNLVLSKGFIGKIKGMADEDQPPDLLPIDDLGARPKSGKVLLTWSAPAGATAYDVLRRISGQGDFDVIAGDYMTDYPTYVDANVVTGQTYDYAIRWKDAAGNTSPDSNVAAAEATERRRR